MEKSKNRVKVFDMVICAMFAAIMCVLSPIAVPIGPVPISLGLLGVMLTAVVLGPIRGFISVTVFLLIGVCGVPIFSGGNSGIAAIIGPTGGYIWSYLIVVFVIGILIKKLLFQNKALQILQIILSCVVGVAVCYLCGTFQFMIVTSTDLVYALTVCVVPFILFDLCKCVLAGVFGYSIVYAINKAGYFPKGEKS